MKKIVVINGAAHSGFGEATAREFLQNGYKIIGFYEEEDKENAVELCNEYPTDITMIQMDSTDVASVEEAVSKIDEKIDGFVNACFFYDMDSLNQYDMKLAEKIFRVNYHVPIFLAAELKKHMNVNSSIVVVTSTEAARGSYGGISYAASKAAVHNMIMSLACNWGKDKVRVNATGRIAYINVNNYR